MKQGSYWQLGGLRAHAAQDEVNLTDIDSLLVKHVPIREVHDFISLGAYFRNSELHCQLGLLRKDDNVVWVQTSELFYIQFQPIEWRPVMIVRSRHIRQNVVIEIRLYPDLSIKKSQ